MARGVSPDLVLVRQFLQTFGSLAAQNAREALACADAAQMNCIREMVVDLDKEEGGVSAAIPRWQRLLEYLATTADNLVIQLITNDLKAQFVAQMTALTIQPQIDKQAVAQALMELRESVPDRNGDRAAAAITAFFDALTESVVDACLPRHAQRARAS
jgi:DNA-binding FadR family transcriptional regulator